MPATVDYKQLLLLNMGPQDGLQWGIVAIFMVTLAMRKR